MANHRRSWDLNPAGFLSMVAMVSWNEEGGIRVRVEGEMRGAGVRRAGDRGVGLRWWGP